MFITFEGPDGSGKTSQVTALADYLCQRGYPAFATREPGGTEIGDQIRKVLFDHTNISMHPRTEILLLLASRAQHVEEIIRPQLAQGTIVLCDRYRDSTLAYQGFGHGVDLETLRMLNGIATNDLMPEMTLLLDLDVEKGLARRAKEGNWNRLDAYPLEFHQRVRKGYLELAHREPKRWVIIEANRPPDEVQEAIQKAVLVRLA
jgi:dTMP kinase